MPFRIPGLPSLRSHWTATRRRRRYRACLPAGSPGVILRYHSVGELRQVSEYLDPALSLPPQVFRAEMALVKERFEVVRPDALLDALARPRKGRPLAVITFDDGYRDNHDIAATILREAGLPAAFYVTTGPLTSGLGLWISELWRVCRRLPEGPLELPGPWRGVVPRGAGRFALRRALTSHLSALRAAEREAALDELAARAGVPRGDGLRDSFLEPAHVKALVRTGMTVGAHTRSHPHLALLDPAWHAEEVAGAKDDLEALLGAQVTHFAYPNPGGAGTGGGPARRAVESAGYASAVTSHAAPLGPECDPLLLPRLGVYAGAPAEILFDELERFSARWTPLP